MPKNNKLKQNKHANYIRNILSSEQWTSVGN